MKDPEYLDDGSLTDPLIMKLFDEKEKMLTELKQLCPDHRLKIDQFDAKWCELLSYIEDYIVAAHEKDSH